MSAQSADATLNHGLVLPGVGDLADPSDLVEYAVAAEDAGWHGVFLYDHLVWPFTEDPAAYEPAADPWLTLSGVATRTEEITLGTWITPVPRRQPWQLARDLATLDHLSDGRVLLGAGLGTAPDFERFGRTYDQRRLGDVFDEALDVIDGLWRGEPFSYDGDHFTLDGAAVLPAPVQQPRIPVVIGGWWPFKAAFHRGSRWDGIAPNWPAMLQGAAESELEGWPDHIREAVEAQRTHEAELREMLSYYREEAGGDGEVLLYRNDTAPPDFVDLCRDVGATWVLDGTVAGEGSHAETLERIHSGPPG